MVVVPDNVFSVWWLLEVLNAESCVVSVERLRLALSRSKCKLFASDALLASIWLSMEVFVDDTPCPVFKAALVSAIVALAELAFEEGGRAVLKVTRSSPS